MTKKKTLLKEGTVRQFMKLANLQPLASGFVDKLYEKADCPPKKEKSQTKDDKEDERLAAETGKIEDKDFTGDEKKKQKKDRDESTGVTESFEGYIAEQEEEELEMGAEEEGPEGEEEEFELEDEVEEEGGDVDVNALVRAIAAAIEAETGVSVDVAEEGGEEEEEVDLGDEEEVELGGEEEEGGEELDFGEEELGGEEEGLEEIISTIAENVTNRLKKMTEAKKKSKKKLSEQAEPPRGQAFHPKFPPADDWQPGDKDLPRSWGYVDQNGKPQQFVSARAAAAGAPPHLKTNPQKFTTTRMVRPEPKVQHVEFDPEKVHVDRTTKKFKKTRTHRAYEDMAKMLIGMGYKDPALKSGHKGRHGYINNLLSKAGKSFKGGHWKGYNGMKKVLKSIAVAGGPEALGGHGVDADHAKATILQKAKGTSGMSGDPEPDELDYQDRRGRVHDAKPGELPPKITPQQRRNLGRE